MAARSKAYVCDRSSAEIVSSNPTGHMNVSVLWVLCIVRQMCLWLADHSSRGVLPTVVRRCVCSRNLLNEEALPHWGLLRQKQKMKRFNLNRLSTSIQLLLLDGLKCLPWSVKIRQTCYVCLYQLQPFPVAARSKAWVCGRWIAGIAGSNPDDDIDVYLVRVLCVFSGRRLCIGLITRPEES